MKHLKKKLALVLSLVLAFSFLLGGCGSISEEIGAGADRPLFTVSGKTCTASEAKLYLATIHNSYKDYMGTDLWEQGRGDSSDASGNVTDVLSEYTEKVTRERLETVYALDLMADKMGLSLTDSENQKISQAASDFYNSLTDEEKSYFGASKDDIAQYYSNFTLAQKAYDTASASGDTNVTDEEARVIQLKIIHTTDASIVEAAQPDASGNAASFDELAAKYTPEEGGQTQDISRGDLPSDIEEAAFQLVNGELSDVLQTSQDGSYYMMYCVSEDDSDLSSQHKEELANQKKEDNFEASYQPFLETLNFKFNEKLWKKLQDIPDKVETSSFFSAYNNYFTSDTSEDSSSSTAQ